MIFPSPLGPKLGPLAAESPSPKLNFLGLLRPNLMGFYPKILWVEAHHGLLRPLTQAHLVMSSLFMRPAKLVAQARYTVHRNSGRP